ncbi:MAG: small ribosomal subunit Rsm22 family protein [Spirochaetia bacterium]|nr:small ribosomal subunit Rsm22 family protein [Spirochaetia bacterium]
MKQASAANMVSEKTKPSSLLASLYPQLLYTASGFTGKNPFLELGSREQARAALKSGQALRQLQRGLTGDRDFAGAAYFSKHELSSAYLLYYWPVSFLQTSLALDELTARGYLPKLGSVLDLGAGPGPASAAAVLRGAKTLLLLDKSKEALRQALSILEAQALGARQPPSGKAILSSSVIDLELLKRLPEGPFDLILACHSANELWKQDTDALEKRARLFGQAIERLTEGGILIIIEPSALVTSRPALSLRNRLLEDFAGRLSCVAPCPGSFPCPILASGEGRSCHSTWVWEPNEPVAALAAAAGLDRDSVKATWFALKKNSQHTQSPYDTTVRSSTSFQQRKNSIFGRVISEPLLNKAGRLRYILCTESGLATFSAKAIDDKDSAGGFFSLRRGDMIEAAHLELREGDNNFGFIAGSKLKIAMKAPEA